LSARRDDLRGNENGRAHAGSSGVHAHGWHGTLQPVADILKLLQKEDIIPAAADKLLFMLAPYIVFVGTYAAFAVLPFSSAYIGSAVDLGLFYIIAVSALVSWAS